MYYVYDNVTKLYKDLSINPVPNSTSVVPPDIDTQFYYFDLDSTSWVLNESLKDLVSKRIVIKSDKKVKDFIDGLQESAFNFLIDGYLSISQLQRYEDKLLLVGRAESGDNLAIDLLTMEFNTRRDSFDSFEDFLDSIKTQAAFLKTEKLKVAMILESYRALISRGVLSLRDEKAQVDLMLSTGKSYTEIKQYIVSKIIG